MEVIKENKSVVTSYRLKEDTKDKIKQQLDQLGLTQEQYFNKVVSMMELENLKKNNIFAVNTMELQDLTQRIYNLFIGLCEQGNSFLNNKDAELEEIKNKYKDMLFNKDNSIIQLKNELQQVYSNLDVFQKEKEEYKNYMLLSDLAEYKQYKIEIEEYKKLLADSQTKNIDKGNIIKANEFKINELNNTIENLKEDNKQQLENIKKENELNIKLAIAEVKEDLDNKLSQEQLKHNKNIEEYQNIYKALLEELEKERSKKGKK
ncbi:hypothetical protein ACFLKB_17710 (plasmid) [Clostridium sp. FAM 1755]|uniref:hypothetical protein n=1 Tax=Clostridium caseinilyticum TaxID=3350403 RepID=UPI0038F61DED